MNGGLTECSSCNGDPCFCTDIKKDKQKQRIIDGQVVIERLWQTMVRLPHWKKRFIMWFWPGIIQVADDLNAYYWADRKDES